jgi:peptide/nickel transport system substrate-binding protein
MRAAVAGIPPRSEPMARVLPLLALAAVALAEPPKHANEIRGEMSTAENMDFRPEDVRRGGTVVLPLLGDVDSFNPYLSSTVDADQVHGLLFPLPLKEHADYHKGPPTFGPALVDTWEVEGTTIRMHVRENARWSDGTPVTSEDVRFSWLAARDRDIAWVNTSIVDRIREVEIVDPKTYVLHYDSEYPDMLMDAKDWRIVPKHVFGKVPFREWKDHTGWHKASGISCGPYKVESYRHNEEIVLVPNATYWEAGLPRLERVIFRVITSQQTQFDALLAGEIDAMQSVKPKDVKRLLEDGKCLLYTFLSRNYGYIGWNCEYPLFRDPAVRRAMTLAIDRENIVESLFYGHAKVSASPIISSMWACDRSLEPHPYDPEAASGILAGLGWKRGEDGILQKDGKRFEFHMSTNAGNEIREGIIQLVKANLKEIGVEVHPRLMDANVWHTSVQAGEEHAWVYGWSVATKVDEKPAFHSSSIGSGFNYSRWRNARVDELIDRGREERDRDKALAVWKEFQAIFHEEQPYTMLYEPRALDAVHKRFRCVRINSLDMYDNLPEWFERK